MHTPAILALEDGTVFRGKSIGALGQSVGEVVFNTAMTGYQEILTDPSYCRQIVTLTYPHIGNTGVNEEDEESASVACAGLVIRDLPLMHSSFRAEQSLEAYLQARNVVAIADIDTRQLTRILRDKGAQSGCILADPAPDSDAAIAEARSFPGLAGMDLARVVGTESPYGWTEGVWALGQGHNLHAQAERHVVAYDFGVKRNILRMLAERGCKVTVVPPTTSSDAVLAMSPDGVFLSNGPGDPAPCEYAITAIRELLDTYIPIFGICLGHHLLALACGADTVKMKFGHHGANHPVQTLADGVVSITSQNHGFAVDETTLPNHVEASHRSLFDGSLQGIQCVDRPAFGFQGNPEASPGPHDIGRLFDRFVDNIDAHRQTRSHA